MTENENTTDKYSKPLSAKSREFLYILSVTNILIGYMHDYDNVSENPKIQGVIDNIKKFSQEFAETSRDLADVYVESFDEQKYSEIIRMALMNCQIMTKYSLPDIMTIFKNGVNGIDIIRSVKENDAETETVNETAIETVNAD